MCVTKAQIRRFAQYLDLPYLEDPTNELMKYERNFIRGEVIPAFADRYKKYLKHYVYRHNEIARRLGLHQIYKQTSAYQMNFGEDGVLIYSISNQKEYSGLGELILKGLKHLNPQGRGVVSKQLAKIEEAMQNDKYGPLSLTGGVKVYLDFNLILLTQKKAPALNFNLGEFETYSFDEYHDFLTEYFDREDNQMSFPFWVIIKGPKLDKRNFQTNFGVDAVSEFRKRGLLYYPALKLWREWSKKKNRHKVLRLFFVDR